MTNNTPSADLWFQLSVVSRLFNQSFGKNAIGSCPKLTTGEARTLEHVSRSFKTRQKYLADALSVEPMTMSAYVDRLLQLNLVTRSPDPIDRRANIISLSEKGEEVHRCLTPIMENLSSKALKGLTREQIQTIASGLDVMRENFRQSLD